MIWKFTPSFDSTGIYFATGPPRIVEYKQIDEEKTSMLNKNWGKRDAEYDEWLHNKITEYCMEQMALARFRYWIESVEKDEQYMEGKHEF